MELYVNNRVKFHMILDLLPDLAKFFFLKKFQISLSFTQAVILLGMGLQFKSLDAIEVDLQVKKEQLLALFNKMIKKFTNFIRGLYENDVNKTEKTEKEFKPVELPKEQISISMKEPIRVNLMI